MLSLTFALPVFLAFASSTSARTPTDADPPISFRQSDEFARLPIAPFKDLRTVRDLHGTKMMMPGESGSLMAYYILDVSYHRRNGRVFMSSLAAIRQDGVMHSRHLPVLSSDVRVDDLDEVNTSKPVFVFLSAMPADEPPQVQFAQSLNLVDLLELRLGRLNPMFRLVIPKTRRPSMLRVRVDEMRLSTDAEGFATLDRFRGTSIGHDKTKGRSVVFKRPGWGVAGPCGTRPITFCYRTGSCRLRDCPRALPCGSCPGFFNFCIEMTAIRCFNTSPCPTATDRCRFPRIPGTNLQIEISCACR